MKALCRPYLLSQQARLTCRRYYSADTSPLIIDHHPAPHSGNIRVLLLDRPANRNALSKRLIADLRRNIDHIKAENGVGATRALIIGSANDGAFCAGADLKERKGMTSEE